MYKIKFTCQPTPRDRVRNLIASKQSPHHIFNGVKVRVRTPKPIHSIRNVLHIIPQLIQMHVRQMVAVVLMLQIDAIEPVQLEHVQIKDFALFMDALHVFGAENVCQQFRIVHIDCG